MCLLYLVFEIMAVLTVTIERPFALYHSCKVRVNSAIVLVKAYPFRELGPDSDGSAAEMARKPDRKWTG